MLYTPLMECSSSRRHTQRESEKDDEVIGSYRSCPSASRPLPCVVVDKQKWLGVRFHARHYLRHSFASMLAKRTHTHRHTCAHLEVLGPTHVQWRHTHCAQTGPKHHLTTHTHNLFCGRVERKQRKLPRTRKVPSPVAFCVVLNWLSVLWHCHYACPETFYAMVAYTRDHMCAGAFWNRYFLCHLKFRYTFDSIDSLSMR